ncbi:MAG: hypothetical protein M1508_06745 [Nitrospirae bacterium]|nr:hypothetical protein [Nitrospirota bacterium]MCL5422994.1 hypothetical protein [Nitrospirota bacterium]
MIYGFPRSIIDLIPAGDSDVVITIMAAQLLTISFNFMNTTEMLYNEE